MRKKIVYIVSPRYSGSTLLAFILGNNSQVSTIGERKKFYVKSLRPNGKGTQKCSCGKQFSECDYWNSIRDAIVSQVSEKDLHTDTSFFKLVRNKYLNRVLQAIFRFLFLKGWSLRLHPFYNKMKSLLKVNEILINEVLAKNNNRIFLDSSKPIQQAMYLSMLEKFDFYVINLTRDPRAQIVSALKYNKWSISDALKYWLREMDKNESIFSSWNGLNKLDVKYEEFCRNPKEKIKEIYDFIGLDFNEVSILPSSKEEQHIMGNKSVMLGSIDEISERKDWLGKLTEEDFQHITNGTKRYSHLYTKV